MYFLLKRNLCFDVNGSFGTTSMVTLYMYTLHWVDSDWPHAGCEEVEEIVWVGGEDDAVGAELGAARNLDTNSMRYKSFNDAYITYPFI